MEPEGLLRHSQVPATGLYPETDQSSLCPPSRFLKLYLNIILPSTPESSSWSPSLRNSHQILHTAVLSHIPATCSAHVILRDLITRTIVEEYSSLCSSLYSFLQSPVTPSVLGPNSPQTPYSQTPSDYVCPSVWATVSHPHNSTGKITVLYI
jgi:hypothetical protein